MTQTKKKINHDFINNSLRIEIINKMVCEALQNGISPDEEHLQDLKQFLKDHINFLETISES